MAGVAAAIIEQCQAIHRQLREEIAGLDRAALHWTPGPETSSIDVIVHHMLGSEAHALLTVRGLPSDRVRAAEFERRDEGVEELLRRIDRADAHLEEHGSKIGDDLLDVVRPHHRMGEVTCLQILLTMFGHNREHLAQLSLTKQLYRQSAE